MFSNLIIPPDSLLIKFLYLKDLSDKEHMLNDFHKNKYIK